MSSTPASDPSPVVIHKSKVDAWLVGVLVVGGAIGFGAAVMAAMASGESIASLVFAGAILGGATLLTLWIFVDTSYTLSHDRLDIRSGPFRYGIPLAAIERVEPTRSPMSSPALSLDRLHIQYVGSKGGVMISPRDKERFFEDLLRRAPALRRTRATLVRSNAPDA